MKEIRLQNFMTEGVVEAGCDEAGRGPLAGPVFAAAVILPPDFHHPLLNDSKQMSEKSRDILRPIIEAEAVAWAVEAVSAAEIDRVNILNASIAGMQRAVMRLSALPQHLLIDGNRWRPFTHIARLCAAGGEDELFRSAPPLAQSLGLASSDVADQIPAEAQTGAFLSETKWEKSLLGVDNSSDDENVLKECVCDGGNVVKRCLSGDELETLAEKYDSIPCTCIVKGDAKFTAVAAASVLAKTHRDEYMRKIALDYPEYGWDRNMGYPTAAHIAAIRLHGLTPHHRLSFRLKKG